MYNYIFERGGGTVNKKDKLRYIQLCKKFYIDNEDFNEFVKLHNLRASIEKIDPWEKLLVDKTEG